MTNKHSKLYQKSRRHSSPLAYCHVSWDTLYVILEFALLLIKTVLLFFRMIHHIYQYKNPLYSLEKYKNPKDVT